MAPVRGSISFRLETARWSSLQKALDDLPWTVPTSPVDAYSADAVAVMVFRGRARTVTNPWLSDALGIGWVLSGGAAAALPENPPDNAYGNAMWQVAAVIREIQRRR